MIMRAPAAAAAAAAAGAARPAAAAAVAAAAAAASAPHHRRPTLLARRTNTATTTRPPQAMRIAEHAAYLSEVAVVSPCPKRLPALLRALEAQGHAVAAPSDRRGLHPLVLPLATTPDGSPAALRGASAPSLAPENEPDASRVAGAELVVGLLRWPDPRQHPRMPLPVVAMSRGATGVRLLARSVDELLLRLLAEEDVLSGAGEEGYDPNARPLADAVGEADAQGLYTRGAADEALAGSGGASAAALVARLPPRRRLAVFLARQSGAMLPDVCEALAEGHLNKGSSAGASPSASPDGSGSPSPSPSAADATSALVAAEWYMRAGHFQGWARPYEFAASLYARLGDARREEARDTARFALGEPWWSLRSYERARQLAGLPDDPRRVKWLLSEQAAAQSAAQKTGFGHREPKTEQQQALERAADLLDLVAAGGAAAAAEEGGGGGEAAAAAAVPAGVVEGPYDGVRARLADAYAEAGLSDAANFIRATM
jgi:hypothetical protein